jgi:hypothetical protein
MKQQINQIKEFKNNYCSTSSQTIDNLEFKIVTCGELNFFSIRRTDSTGARSVGEKYFFEKYKNHLELKRGN